LKSRARLAEKESSFLSAICRRLLDILQDSYTADAARASAELDLSGHGFASDLLDAK
jgi:hypothetical protein